MSRSWRSLSFQSIGLVIILAVLTTIWTWKRMQDLSAQVNTIPHISPEQHLTLAEHAVNKTVIMVPVNEGMLHLAKNLLCSLQTTSFNTSNLIFWTLDEGAESALTGEGWATYRDQSLFSVSTNENREEVTAAYRRMMKERPKFFLKILSAGYNILMLDADTVFWQSPLSLVPEPSEDVDVVFSTDSREFYQSHNAFSDARRRGSNIPPICNGIFWMRTKDKTRSLWSDMLMTFNAPGPVGWWRRIGFQDDQRGMDVLLNDGRARVVGPFPEGIEAGMVPNRHTGGALLKIRLLDQTMVVNGHLLMSEYEQYEDNLSKMRIQGRERIAAHFNWDTREMSKETGARNLGMYFLRQDGSCPDGK